MDILSMLRTLGALGLVLGMLAGALWAVRRYDLRLPGRVAGGGRKRVELVERLAVDAKRSVALIRRDGCEHLILIGPEGHATIETGIVSPVQPVAAEAAAAEAPARIEEDVASLKAGVAKLAGKLDFRAMVDRMRPEPAAEPARVEGEGEVEAEVAVEIAPEPVVEAEVATVVAQQPRVLVAANDAEPAPEEAAAPAAKRSRKSASRTRVPRDTTRWNKRAVREALNA